MSATCPQCGAVFVRDTSGPVMCDGQNHRDEVGPVGKVVVGGASIRVKVTTE